jgi:ATP-binding cassette subfamily C protein LapB
MPQEAQGVFGGRESVGDDAPPPGAQQPAGRPASARPASQGAGAAAPNIWPMEADRIAIRSPLVEALRLLAGYYGRRTSPSALTAGLPIPPSGITPALFIRAAARADLHARMAERSLEALAIAPTLPCILVLEREQACILWEVRYPDKHPPKKEPGQQIEVHPETAFIVQFPETPDTRHTITLTELKKLHADYAFFVRPVARADDRAGPAEIDTAKDWFWSALKEHVHIYREVIAAALMINIFAMVTPLFTMNVYDRVVPNSAFETLWVLSAGVITVYLFDFLLKNLRAHFLDVAGRKADVKISAALFEQIMGMTMTARPASAGILASNMREFEGLRDFFTSASLTALIDLPFVILFIILIAIIAGPLAFVTAAAVPIVILAGMVLQKPMQQITRQSMNESALKNALLFETITGLETIKTQAAEGHTQRRWEELTDKASRTAVKSKRVSAFALYFAIFVQQVTGVAVVIVGVYLIAAGYISMGALIASVMISSRALAPLAQVAGLLTRFNQSREALEQLDSLMKKEVERPAGKHFISMPTVAGKVEFKEVVFAYPGQSVPALNGVSFTIEPGDKVGIIGAVGSGKTTVERLLLNLYQPTSGSVQLDGTDVRQIDPGDLRRSIGAVQQSPQLFYGSVRENITLGHETAPDRSVLRAAELSGVLEFLRDSQHGLDTQVGERGEALSGGQRQAVAIARSLLYDPHVLVMDEPTASMDPASENRLRKRLQTLCANKTTILITHKSSMLILVNKLILIDRGRIVAYGPRDEVIARLQARQYGTQAENTEV